MPTIDLLALAPQGTWHTGTLAANGHDVVGSKPIGFGGTDTDPTGFVRRQTLVGEDGASHDALWTHPKWAAQGTIKGHLPWQILPAGAVFVAKVGFRQGATTSDGVRFSVWAHYHANNAETWTRVIDLPKKPSGALTEIRADLSWLAGKSCRIELRVDAGKASTRDWAIWVAPRIASREGPAGRTWRLRPTQLRIDRRDPDERSGDDPALVAMYFRTTLGHLGSSKVVTRTKLVELSTDRKHGAIIAIPASADLTVDDVLTPWSAGDLLSTDGVSLAGLVVIGIEKDSAGDDTVRDKVAAKATALRAALRAYLEPLTVTAIIANTALLADAIAKVSAAVSPPSGPIVTGGGLDLVGAIGHDLVGDNRVTLFGIDQAAFEALAPLAAAGGITLDPDASDEPIAPLLPRQFHLPIAGSGSKWTIDVALEQVAGLVPIPGGI